jgi:hypothetical protein
MRELPNRDFDRHERIKHGPRRQTLCQRCQLERESKRLRSRLEELDASWRVIQAAQIRRAEVSEHFEQSRLRAAGE